MIFFCGLSEIILGSLEFTLISLQISFKGFSHFKGIKSSFQLILITLKILIVFFWTGNKDDVHTLDFSMVSGR